MKLYEKWQEDKNFIIDNDKLKGKSYIFSSFPTANKYGFQTGKIRPLIYGDILARYERLINKNVLYPTGYNTLSQGSFIESRKSSNLLDDSIANIFKTQMLKLGIGINEQKIIDMRHDEYLSLLQLSFIDLYEMGYIEYKKAKIYQDNKTKKYFDFMQKPSYSEEVIEKVFVLKCDSIINDVIKNINELNVKDEIKNKLLNVFDKDEVFKIHLKTTAGNILDIDMENPAYIGGISYILLNPDFINVTSYISPDELNNYNQYLKDRNGLYIFSGNCAINPLTGNEIPILISDLYSVGIYAANPAIDNEDKSFAITNEMPIYEILNEDKTLINSDFLDCMNVEAANDLIINEFINANIGELKTIYKHTEILLSSNDPFGALYPFLENGNTINSIKGYLPLKFSIQFRPTLSNDCAIPGDVIQGTINSLFTLGMAPILSIIYDEFGSLESIFSQVSREDFIEWGSIKALAINEDQIYTSLLMPIIFSKIISKELLLPDLIKNVIIIPNTYDKDHDEIKRSNNNMFNIDELCNIYDSDSIRLYFMLSNLEEDFIFDEKKLKTIDSVIERAKTTILNPRFVDSNELEFAMFELESKSRVYLRDNDVLSYAKLIYSFTKSVILNANFTKTQLLKYLIIAHPILPFLSEYAYNEIFNDRYSIVNEGWPQ